MMRLLRFDVKASQRRVSRTRHNRAHRRLNPANVGRQPEIYRDRGIVQMTRHAHRTSANAAAVVSMKTGFLASETPSAMARQMCAAKTRANTVPEVMT
jgi:hypothetical protein